jgi:hypothetical protein
VNRSEWLALIVLAAVLLLGGFAAVACFALSQL